MLSINKNSSYLDVQSVINKGVSVDTSGIVTSPGTDNDKIVRQQTLDSLLVSLKYIDQSTEYRLGVKFVLENDITGLKACPRVSVLRKTEEGDLKKIVNVDYIPEEWLDILSKARTRFKQWMDGNITAYADAWPIGFIEDDLPDSGS